jgi:predicted AAA+ superfamily ATPase
MKLSRIIEYNTWWDTKEVRKELCPIYERRMLGDIVSSLENRNITVLRGPRRTGKSTLLYQSIRSLLFKGVDPVSILYFSFDDEPGNIQDLLDEFRDSVLEHPIEKSKKLYVFLDEVQKCNNWSEQIKRNYDLYPNIKFILSGSVSFEIGAKTTESLVGRASELILYPMSFGEYLGLRNIKAPQIGDSLKRFLFAEKRLRPYFNHYLMTGGFPELAFEESQNRIKDYIQSSIIQRAIYGDLFQLGSIGDPESMMALVRAIAEMPGILLNYDRLGSDIGRDRRTVSSYISRLEYSMILRTLGNIRGSGLSSSRKLRKAYPMSTAMTFVFKGFNVEGKDIGRIIEIAVLNEINAKYFWRHRGSEIDFIVGNKGETAVEVKFGKGKNLFYEQYARGHKLEMAFLISKNEHGIGQVGSMLYQKVPAWALCAGADVKGIRNTPLK